MDKYRHYHVPCKYSPLPDFRPSSCSQVFCCQEETYSREPCLLGYPVRKIISQGYLLQGKVVHLLDSRVRIHTEGVSPCRSIRILVHPVPWSQLAVIEQLRQMAILRLCAEPQPHPVVNHFSPDCEIHQYVQVEILPHQFVHPSSMSQRKRRTRII